MQRCLTPGCPVACGSRRRPSCADLMLVRVLAFLLVSVLAVSLWMGFRSIRSTIGSTSLTESAPVAGAEVGELLGESSNDAGERVVSDADGESAVTADAVIEVA